MRRLLLPYLLLLSSATLAQPPAHHHRHAPSTSAPARQEQAYYCASGNVVKYHSSAHLPRASLNRCSAAVKPLALSEAQGRMQPCKICH